MSAMPAANVPARPPAGSTESSSPVVRRKFYTAAHPRDVRAFPLASARPELPPALADELVDFYAFIFCQGGGIGSQLSCSFLSTHIHAFAGGDLSSKDGTAVAPALRIVLDHQTRFAALRLSP